MKKLLFLLQICFVFLILLKTDLNARNYKPKDIIEGVFELNKNFHLNLPKGKWTVVSSSNELYYGLYSKYFSLVRLDQKSVVEHIEIAEMYTAGLYEDDINKAIYEAIFKNKYDGCYERPEYFLIKIYKKGSTHNCFVVDHSDVYKDFFTPDDPQVSNAQLKKWVRENNIQLPKVGLSSFHAYFSRLAKGKWYLLSYGIDPELLNAPKNKFINEENSEYHKNNISNYPEHQKTMEKWVSISAKRHMEFEKIIKVIERHKLDLNELILSDNNLNDSSSDNFINQINKLNDLYKNGVITKEEFEIAKKKILN